MSEFVGVIAVGVGLVLFYALAAAALLALAPAFVLFAIAWRIGR